MDEQPQLSSDSQSNQTDRFMNEMVREDNLDATSYSINSRMSSRRLNNDNRFSNRMSGFGHQTEIFMRNPNRMSNAVSNNERPHSRAFHPNQTESLLANDQQQQEQNVQEDAQSDEQEE